jgi:hypothetical protein
MINSCAKILYYTSYFCRRFACHASQSRSAVRYAHLVSPISTIRRPWTFFITILNFLAFQGLGFSPGSQLNGGKPFDNVLGASAAELFGFCGALRVSQAQPRRFEAPSVHYVHYVHLATHRLSQIECKRNTAHRFLGCIFSWHVVSSFTLFHFCFSSFHISAAAQRSQFVIQFTVSHI